MIFNLIKRAKELFFDNSKSGLEATDVQGAIDEVNNKLVKTYEFSHSASIAAGEHKEVILHLGGIPEGATVLCAIGNLASNTAWIQTQVGMKADKSNVILGFYNTYTSTLDALVYITVLYI